MQIRTSVWEFSFEFAHLVATGDGDGDAEPGVLSYPIERLIMSPQHAKAFARILDLNVHRYEQQFGEVHVPEELTENHPTADSEGTDE